MGRGARERGEREVYLSVVRQIVVDNHRYLLHVHPASPQIRGDEHATEIQTLENEIESKRKRMKSLEGGAERTVEGERKGIVHT